MEACLIIGGVLMTAGVVAVLLVFLKPSTPPAQRTTASRRPRHPYEYCPACDAPVLPADHNCPDCGLALDSRLAARVERLRIARNEVRHLIEDGHVDAETADRVAEQLDRRRRELLRREEKPAPAPAAPVAAPEHPQHVPPPLPPRHSAAEVPPPTPPPRPIAPPQAAAPRRPLAEVLGQYMHERNILWGELAGGLLIVGCSIALILSLWQTLEELPYFTFLLFAGITAAVFGAGEYTLHHWRLTATSRGLLVIALLLAPLNLLLLADPGARGTTTALDTVVKVVAVLALAWLVRTGGRDLVRTDDLPGRIPRQWLLALAVIGAPASLMVPLTADAGVLRLVPLWLPLACFAVPGGMAVSRLSRDHRRDGATALGEQRAAALLVFVGLGLFALFVTWGFLLTRAGNLPETLRDLALPTVLAGLPVLSAGLLVQRRLTEPAGLRATGTGVAVTGMMILVASLVLAWPDPIALLAASAAVALVLGWVGFRDELPWVYVVAIPCAALAVVLGYQGLTAGWTIPDGVTAGRWLGDRLSAAESGAVLVALALVLGVASEAWVRRGRHAEGLAYALGAAGLSAAGLMILTVHGVERPALAAWAHLAAAGGFVAASFRWRYRVVPQVGVWLVLLASLWGLWATIPSDRAGWGLAIGLESLTLALLAVALGRTGFGRLRDACRDVAAAAAVLAPLLGVAVLPGGAVHTGTLAAVAASVLVLALLYRQPVLTWVGSFTALVALAHLTTFTVRWEPWHGALLLALLMHATLATTASLLVGQSTARLERRKPPDGDQVGLLAWLRSLDLYAEPLRLSGRLTACLAVPLLFLPAAGLAPAWVGLTIWAGGLWLIAAFAWRERGAFPVFQLAFTWAAGLAGFAWVERQPWYGTSPLGPVDPRALQAYGVAVGFLSVAWAAVRRALRPAPDVRGLWAEWRPSVDQVVLAVLIAAQLLLAAVAVAPAVVAELTPAGLAPRLVPFAEAPHVWGPGGWFLLGVLTTALIAYLRWPGDDSNRVTGPLLGLIVLALTVPFLVAGLFAPQVAAASALRWGLAAVFLVGSAAMAAREPLGRGAARAGFPVLIGPGGRMLVRGFLAGGAAVVLLLSVRVAWLGLTGLAPSGPAGDSVFGQMGWTASVILPLAALVVGLAGMALRERSAGYAFAGGWVWTATVAGGYALAVVAGGGVLDAAQQVRVSLLAIAATSVWALGWLAVERRVPGKGLLTVHAAVGLLGLTAVAAIPLVLLLLFPGRPLGPASARLGQDGWLALVAATLAAGWHAHRAGPWWRPHALGLAALLSGILAACTVTPWDRPDAWLSLHLLAAYWAVCGLGMTLVPWQPRAGQSPTASHLAWPQVFAVGLVVLGLRGGWDDPVRPLAPAGMVLVAGLLFGVVAMRARSRPHEYLSGLLAALAAGLVWVAWGPASLSSLALAVAVGLALAGAAWSGLVYRESVNDRRPESPEPDDLGLPVVHTAWLPPFPHFAAAAALGLVLFGLLPTLAGAAIDPRGLAWGAVASSALALAALLWDRTARAAPGGVYTLGVAAVGLAVAHLWPGPVWLDWRMPLALAGYVLAAAGIAAVAARRPESLARLRLPDRAPGEVRDWLVVGQAIVGALLLAMAVRTSVGEAELALRLMGAVSAALLVAAAALLVRVASPVTAAALRPAALGLGAAALALLAWAVPDPAGPVPWLHRHGGLFVALSAAAALYSFVRAAAPWAGDFRRVGGVIGALAVAVLVLFLVQQLPLFDPATRKTPLGPAGVFLPLAATLGLMALAVWLALRPDRDPLGPTPQGRAGYVYLAEVLLVLLFVHVRLNIPQVFIGQAVKYWTFLVMFLAFVGVGTAEWFTRRGVRVLARPLHRTGVLLPLIPLVAFWAKPPGLVMEFADARAPGLRPMLGYLENLPQHFDTYALLWFLAGLLYGLIALSRRSFGWALLGALATNFGLWALLSHHQVPAAVHPQAWAIPLALIILVSEHVNRSRLRAETAAGLRYLGISMIYVASAADLFIAGVGQSLWLPVILAALCLAGVFAGVLLRVRAFLYLGIGFLLLDVFSMIWHAAVDRHQTWVWYASGIVLGGIILALFAVLEKRRNDVRELVGRLREWNA